MDDLIELLKSGRLDVFVVLALLFALVWTVKQWRQAERDKDRLHEERLTDAKEMSVLAAEVKNVMAVLVNSVKQ